MTTTKLNIHTDKSIKDSICEHSISFEFKLEVPNDTTVAAIKEGKKVMNDPSTPRYSNMDTLKAHWMNEIGYIHSKDWNRQ